MQNEKLVVFVLGTDLVHSGHILAIQNARKLGKVVVGVLPNAVDENIDSFSEKKNLFKSISGVSEVVCFDRGENFGYLSMHRPEIVVIGIENSNQVKVSIQKVIEPLVRSWDGKVIDIEKLNNDFTISSFINSNEKLPTIDGRRSQLKKLLKIKRPLRFMEAHNGLTGLIIENAKIKVHDETIEYDGIWLSSLTNSAIKGKPDIEAVDHTSRSQALHDILEVTTKPIIYDGDSGGRPEHFSYTVKTLERLGVSAIIIEDKVGLKRNSHWGTDVFQTQASVEEFCEKIEIGCLSRTTTDFLIIARIESLILGNGVEDALNRAEKYIQTGADAIMIHSKKYEPDEVFQFSKKYLQLSRCVPLIVAPSSKNETTTDQWASNGIGVVIYANQLLRSAYPVMKEVAESILLNGRAKEIDDRLLPIGELLRLIPGT